MTRSPLVEILYFDGCPNHEAARAMVDRVTSELGLEPELRLVNVTDEETAQRLRFLGSPTIRVRGRDIDPGAAQVKMQADPGVCRRLQDVEVG